MRLVQEADVFDHLTIRCMRCMFSRSGSDLDSLSPTPQAFGDLAERPIQKRSVRKKAMSEKDGGSFARALVTTDAVFACAMVAPCLTTAVMPSASTPGSTEPRGTLPRRLFFISSKRR